MPALGATRAVGGDRGRRIAGLERPNFWKRNWFVGNGLVDKPFRLNDNEIRY